MSKRDESIDPELARIRAQERLLHEMLKTTFKCAESLGVDTSGLLEAAKNWDDCSEDTIRRPECLSDKRR